MKKVPYSLLSGIMAIVLFLSPFANSVTFAAEGGGNSAQGDNYGAQEDNYGAQEDNYGDEENYDGDDGDYEWDGKNAYTTVTGETYYNYYLDGETVGKYLKDGNVKTEKTRLVKLNADAIQAIKDHATFSTVKGTLINFPKAALEQILNSGNSKDGVSFTFNDVTSEYADSLSEAIEFIILNGDYEQFKGELDTPITVSFFVDKNKVKNWADLTLVYVDEDGNKKYYPNQVKSINPDTGEVVVEIYHFSTYYIAEVAGQGAGAGVIVGQGGPGNGDVTVNGQGGPADGKTLPNTATNSYNLLLAGALTLALGLGAVVLYRRKKAL